MVCMWNDFIQSCSLKHERILNVKVHLRTRSGNVNIIESKARVYHILISAIKHTVKFLNFRTPENFAVIYLKLKQRGKTFGYFVKKMQME